MKHLRIYKSSFPKFRCGNKKDGGYIISDLPNGYDAFFSGGIANDISFEEAFLEKYQNLTCHAYDGTIDKLPKESKKIIFNKKNLGN